MKYTKDHEWLRVEGDLVVVGITEHAATQLGDVVFVELPEPETMVAEGDEVVRDRKRQGRVGYPGPGGRRDRRGEPKAGRQPRPGERGPDRARRGSSR